MWSALSQSIYPLPINIQHMADTSIPRLLLIGLLVGAVSGVGAVFFFKGIALGSQFLLHNILGYRYPTEGLSFADAASWAPPETVWLILPILLLGALISGLIVWKFAPEAEGHGKIPERDRDAVFEPFKKCLVLLHKLSDPLKRMGILYIREIP